MTETAAIYRAGNPGTPWRCLNCGMRLGTITVSGHCRLRTWRQMEVELGEIPMVRCPICGAWRPWKPIG